MGGRRGAASSCPGARGTRVVDLPDAPFRRDVFGDRPFASHDEAAGAMRAFIDETLGARPGVEVKAVAVQSNRAAATSLLREKPQPRYAVTTGI